MCGLAGYQGVTSGAIFPLVRALGEAIDGRGGHGAGYVAIGPEGLHYNRKAGRWDGSSNSFVRRAVGASAILHARYATCAARTLDNAHPFAIRRNGRTVLYGAHNGIIYDAEESAKGHGRKYTVDSRELFELLADGRTEEISKLSGYGVLTWIDARTPHVVKLVKLTDSGEIEVKRLESGGLVWGSTLKIVNAGLDAAKLETKKGYTLETGAIYSMEGGEIFATSDRLTVEAYKWKPSTNYVPYSGPYDYTGGYYNSRSRKREIDEATDLAWESYDQDRLISLSLAEQHDLSLADIEGKTSEEVEAAVLLLGERKRAKPSGIRTRESAISDARRRIAGTTPANHVGKRSDGALFDRLTGKVIK